MGSVKRIKDKTYRIVYDIPSADGTRKQKRETVYNVTKAEAEATLAKRKEQARTSQYVRDKNFTIADLFAEFFQVKEQNLSDAVSSVTRESSRTTSSRRSAWSRWTR